MEIDELFINKLASKWNIPSIPRDDLKQEFRIIYEKCNKNFKEDRDTKFSTYFMTACKNKVKELRKRYTPLPVKDLSDYVQEIDKSEAVTKEIIEYIDTMKNGDVLRAYYLEGKTQDVIAKEKGVSQPYIAKLVREGVQELREQFNS